MSAVPAKDGHTEKETIQRKASDDLLYKIDDVPPWYKFLGDFYLLNFVSQVHLLLSWPAALPHHVRLDCLHPLHPVPLALCAGG